MQKLQLSIPEPCHENWQKMTSTNQGRFCNACAKEVVDFSMMTDIQVLNYFSNLTHEKVCGRALPEQLNRTISRPISPKKRLFWYWNYIVMFFLFLGKGNAVKAQGGIKPVTECSPVKPINLEKRRVTDQAFDTIQGLRITSSNKATSESETRIRMGGISSMNTNNVPLLVVDYLPVPSSYLSSLMPNDVESIEVLKAGIALALYGTDARHGVIAITTKKKANAKMQMAKDSIAKKLLNKVSDKINTAINTNTLKVYPNPIQKGNTFFVSFKQQLVNDFNIRITDIQGKLLFQKQINTLSKEHFEKIVTDASWSSGVYYINLIDKNNKLISKKSFIVQ